jgi:hypothetical protein
MDFHRISCRRILRKIEEPFQFQTILTTIYEDLHVFTCATAFVTLSVHFQSPRTCIKFTNPVNLCTTVENKNENFALGIVCVFPAPYQLHYNRTWRELRMDRSAVTRIQGNHKLPSTTPTQNGTPYNRCPAVLLEILFPFLSAAQQPISGLGRLTVQISISHTDT